MGIILKVTPEVLISMSGDMEKQLNDIQNQFNSIDTEINRTRFYWEGDASDAHKSQYDSLKNEINESVKRLKNHPTNLLQMAGLYKENESDLTAVAQSLSADVII